MMWKHSLSWLFVLVVGLFTSAPSAFAQPRYYPPTGPISPWMNIFQRQPGPLDNYHSYVRPELQLRNTLGQQNTALQQQATGIRLLGENHQAGQIPATGTASGFMNFSHYYPTMGGFASFGRSHGPARTALSAGSRGSTPYHP
jgi:hypothetical protein